MTNEHSPGKDKNPSRHKPPSQTTRRPARPPDSIPDILPGVDPQQTPGIDRPPAENDPDNKHKRRS